MFLAPVVLEYVPATHSAHSWFAEYLPAGHETHVVALTSEYVAVGQEMQAEADVLPLILEYLPAAQAIHDVGDAAPATGIPSQTEPMPPPQK